MAQRARTRTRRPRRELLPGVTRRAAVLVIGVLLLQFGFVLSYVGAFHAPTPRDVPLAVVAPAGAPAGTAASVAGRLDGLRRGPAGRPGRRQRGRRPGGCSPTATVDGVLLLGADGPGHAAGRRRGGRRGQLGARPRC